MNNKEQIISLLDKIPDYKMGYVLAYIQGITADEELDDQFCEKMVQDYLNDADPGKHETVTVDELASELGICL